MSLDQDIKDQIAAARQELLSILPAGLTLTEPADELFDRSSQHTSHSPERRALQARFQYLGHVTEIARTAGRFLAGEDLDRLRDGWSRYLSTRGSCVSWAQTGPSGFPVNKAAKANKSANKAQKDLMATAAQIVKRTKREAKAAEVSEAGGPIAVKTLEIADDEKTLVLMTAANKIVRSKPPYESTPAKLGKLQGLGLSADGAGRLFVADFCGRYGFPAYVSANMRKNLKSKKARLDELKHRESTAGREAIEFRLDGVTVTVDFDDDRIRIRHDGNPGDEMNARFQGEGWKWSPLNRARQRQLTGNACYSAGRMLGSPELGAKLAAAIK